MSAVLKSPQPRIRPMREDDLDDVHRIERRNYEFPWTRTIFGDCLRVGYSCWVMELDESLIGYGVLSAGAGEAHILNVCLDRDWQGQGLGRRLLARLVDLARWHKAITLFLEVRPTNTRAIKLYESYGFKRVGRRPNYYPAEGGREDALGLSFKLIQETDAADLP